MTSSKNKTELRERLLAAETTDAALRGEYERKLVAMFELQLSTAKKVWLKVLTLFSVACCALALTLALTEKLPPGPRTALLIGAAFAAAWTVYLSQLLRRGTFRRRIDAPMAAGMAFAFSLAMCVVLAVAGVPTEKILLIGMLFLLPAGLILLRTIIEQSEMRMQEQLVELQYRIARLAEKFDDDDSAGVGVIR
jgi:Kef-type K+ transport system membrane component KefB